MKILITSATQFELAGIVHYLNENASSKDDTSYTFNNHDITVLITGVGMVSTTLQLTYALCHAQYDLVVNIGIAGAFNKDFNLGDVVEINKDVIADLGVEEKDGYFTSIFDLELIGPDQFPYNGSWLHNSSPYDFKKCTGLTVNMVSGSQPSIDEKIKKYPNADVETMEGASFLYTCLSMKAKCLSLRSISNYVEPRNRSNWEIELALENLTSKVSKFLTQL